MSCLVVLFVECISGRLELPLEESGGHVESLSLTFPCRRKATAGPELESDWDWKKVGRRSATVCQSASDDDR